MFALTRGMAVRDLVTARYIRAWLNVRGQQGGMAFHTLAEVIARAGADH